MSRTVQVTVTDSMYEALRYQAIKDGSLRAGASRVARKACRYYLSQNGFRVAFLDETDPEARTDEEIAARTLPVARNGSHSHGTHP